MMHVNAETQKHGRLDHVLGSPALLASIIAECEALGLFLQVCRIGHKNDRPDVRVAVKTLIRSHRNFDEKALKHEIHIMQVVCNLHRIVMNKAGHRTMNIPNECKCY